MGNIEGAQHVGSATSTEWPRGEFAVRWIEFWCRTATGFRKLTPEQRQQISALYDEASSPGMPSLEHLDGELVACLRLLHLCGPQYVRGSTIAASPPPTTFLRF
jgi:hypothetical protein